MVKEAEPLKEFLKMIGATGTKEILEFLDENKEGRYKDFLQFVTCHMLNIRLRQLLEFDLIEYNGTRSVRKKEWYNHQ